MTSATEDSHSGPTPDRVGAQSHRACFLPRGAHLAPGADEAAHVLHHPDDGQLHLVTEADFFPDILEGHLLSTFKRPVVSKSKFKKEKACVVEGWLQNGVFIIIKPERHVPFIQ